LTQNFTPTGLITGRCRKKKRPNRGAGSGWERGRRSLFGPNI